MSYGENSFAEGQYGDNTFVGDAPTIGQIAVTGGQPAITLGQSLTPVQGAITFTGYQPEIPNVATIGQITVTGGQPSINIGQSLTPVHGSIGFTGYQATESPNHGEITFTGNQPSVNIGQSLTPVQGAIAFTGHRPGSVIETPLQGYISFNGGVPTFGAILITEPGLAGHKFRCYLIGNAETELVISNLSGQIRSTGTSSISIVIPDGYSYADIITDELTNYVGTPEIKIDAINIYTDGSEVTTVFNEGNFAVDTVRSDKGAKSYSISIRAIKTFTPGPGNKVQLAGVSYIADQGNGKRRVRSSFNKNVVPGDVVVYDNDNELLVDSISYVIAPKQLYMECVS